MTDVLLLNATHEPLRIVKLARAVVLVLQEKAEIVEAAGEIRSATTVMPKPSVIRLTRYVQIPWKAKVPLNRRTLSIRDNHECQVVGCTRVGNTIDHIQPRSRGGRHEWANVTLMCGQHNFKKGDKTLAELGWELKTQPTVPRRIVLIGMTENPLWVEHLSYTS